MWGTVGDCGGPWGTVGDCGGGRLCFVTLKKPRHISWHLAGTGPEVND